MRFKSRLKPAGRLIDLTPLVDVIFLLLIFFVITSDVLPLKSLHVENPSLNRDTTPLTTQLPVIMDAHHVIYIGHHKEIIDLASFQEALRDEIARIERQTPGTNPTIVLSVDQRAEYGAFLPLFSLAQECAPQVRLVYRPMEEGQCSG